MKGYNQRVWSDVNSGDNLVHFFTVKLTPFTFKMNNCLEYGITILQ